MIRVSNAAAATVGEPPRNVSSHSRMPRPLDTRRSPARRAESARDSGFDIPWACVGPPTTRRPTSAGMVGGAAPTSTTSTVASPGSPARPPGSPASPTTSPSAIARAIASVFPNINSKTTSARMGGYLRGIGYAKGSRTSIRGKRR